MKPRKNDSEPGFTLIEVIITLVIVAVVAAMMTAYFGTGITQSSIPIFRLGAAGKLNEVMEKITAQYSQYPQWQKNTQYAAGTIILPTTPKRTGLLYTTTSGGTSGATEPTSWPRTQDGTISDNTITWTTVWTSGTNGAVPTLALTGWVPNHLYSQMSPTTPASIVYANGNLQYLCTTGGTTAHPHHPGRRQIAQALPARLPKPRGLPPRSNGNTSVRRLRRSCRVISTLMQQLPFLGATIV
jgi:prepilin-type N-terminal cleavage/methylation domain-containing protein